MRRRAVRETEASAAQSLRTFARNCLFLRCSEHSRQASVRDDLSIDAEWLRHAGHSPSRRAETAAGVKRNYNFDYTLERN